MGRCRLETERTLPGQLVPFGPMEPSVNEKVLSSDSVPAVTPKTRARAVLRGKKRHFYKPLQVRFRHNGFDYHQIAREGDVAIYEQTWPDSENVCYEVVRIRSREGFKIGDEFIEPAEVYPKSEAWGEDGFTLTDKNAAFAKLRELAE